MTRKYNELSFADLDLAQGGISLATYGREGPRLDAHAYEPPIGGGLIAHSYDANFAGAEHRASTPSPENGVNADAHGASGFDAFPSFQSWSQQGGIAHSDFGPQVAAGAHATYGDDASPSPFGDISYAPPFGAPAIEPSHVQATPPAPVVHVDVAPPAPAVHVDVAPPVAEPAPAPAVHVDVAPPAVAEPAPAPAVHVDVAPPVAAAPAPEPAPAELAAPAPELAAAYVAPPVADACAPAPVASVPPVDAYAPPPVVAPVVAPAPEVYAPVYDYGGGGGGGC